MRKKFNILFLIMVLLISTLAGCGRKDNVSGGVIKEGTTINFYAWSENKDSLVITAERLESITDENINLKIQAYGILPSNITILSVTKQNEANKLLKIDYSDGFAQYLNSLNESDEYLTVTTIVNTYLDAYGYDQVQLTCVDEPFKTNTTDYSQFISFRKDLKNPYYVEPVEEIAEEVDPETIDEFAEITTLFDTIDNTYDGSNLIISPISLYADLSILDDSAVGETKSLIDEFIGDQSEIKNDFSALLLDPNLKMYNGVFYHKGGTDTKSMTVEFTKELEKYRAEVFSSNMNLRDTSLAMFNKWVAAKTKNDIPKFMKTVSKDTQLYLIGINKFDLKFNNEVYNLEFETDEENSILVKMMEFDGAKSYYENDAATGIGMNVNNARYKLVCVMPNNSRTKISDINISELMETEKEINKNCYVPIIAINNVVKMNTPLSSTTLTPIFTSNADFSAMFDNVTNSFGVSEIAQINYFNFNSSFNKDSSNELVSNSEEESENAESTEGEEETTEEDGDDVDSASAGDDEEEVSEDDDEGMIDEDAEEAEEETEVENEDVDSSEEVEEAVSSDNAEKIATVDEVEVLESEMELVDIANSYVLSQKFYYFIIDNKTDAIIFLGKYAR